MICCIYRLINYLVCQETILSYHYMQIIIVSNVYSVVLCHRYHKTMELFYCLIWCVRCI